MKKYLHVGMENVFVVGYTYYIISQAVIVFKEDFRLLFRCRVMNYVVGINLAATRSFKGIRLCRTAILYLFVCTQNVLAMCLQQSSYYCSI